MIACPYCRVLNEPNSERCSRCGHRRSGVGSNSNVAGSAVPAMRLVPEVEEAKLPAPARSTASQSTLFREATAHQKVVPIPTLTPLHLPEERRPRKPGTRSVQQMNSRSRRISEAQQTLDWGQPLQSQPRPEEKISCAAPVAPRALRLTATAVDGAAVIFGTAIMGTIYVWQGGEVNLGGGFLMLGALLAVVSVLYRALWTMADGDTPGMQFAGLILVDFDGRPPSRRQRVIRHVASILSLGAAGVGILWALVDDEGLTWHDHISKTFPTPKPGRLT